MAEKTKEMKVETQEIEQKTVNPLSGRTVIVRSLVRNTNLYKDPNHIMHGGHDTFECKYVTPMLSNGQYVNVLTNDELRFFEDKLGRSLSIYDRKDNFWDELKITLRKGDNRFKMSDPYDYIKLKVLKANREEIASSMNELNDRPRPTYRFVIIDEGEVKTNKLRRYNANQNAARLLGKYEDDRETLITLLEMLSGRPVSNKVETEDLLVSLDEYVASDAKLFVKMAEDPLLKVKSLLRRCVAAKLVSKRGGYYYLASDNSPLCDDGQEPTLSIAATYISDPRRAELKYSLEKKLSE